MNSSKGLFADDLGLTVDAKPNPDFDIPNEQV